jgi:dephospho-CoA kinase
MRSHENILEGIQQRRELENQFRDDIVGDSLSESIEFDSMYSQDLENIDEAKAVTFGGKSYPKYGWSIIMAGGAGSGKGFTIGKQVLIDAKIVDVDKMKSMFAKASAKNQGNIAQKTGGKSYNFKNPNDVADLHAIIGTEMELDKKAQANLIGSMSKGSELTNIIFDITGKASTKLMNLATTTKKLGYKTSLVWVVTNRQVAMLRNLMRDRVVGERLFHEIHNQVNTVLMDFLQSSDAKDFDEAWIVFSGSSEVSDLSPEAQKELFNNSVFKLSKKGQAFEIPDDLNKKIVEFLGPQEVNPKDPVTYVGYDAVKDKIAPFQADTGSNPKGYKDLKFTR